MLSLFTNFWFYEAVLGCALVIALKFLRRHLYATKERRLSVLIDAGVMVGFTVGFGVLLFFESCNGIVQFFLDYFISEQDSPAWAVIFMPIAIMIATALYGYLLTQMSALGVRLVKRYNRCLRQQEERAALAKHNQRMAKRGDIPEVEIVDLDLEESEAELGKNVKTIENRYGFNVERILANLNDPEKQKQPEKKEMAEEQPEQKEVALTPRQQEIQAELNEFNVKQTAKIKASLAPSKPSSFIRPASELLSAEQMAELKNVLDQQLEGASAELADEVREYFANHAEMALKAIGEDCTIVVRKSIREGLFVSIKPIDKNASEQFSSDVKSANIIPLQAAI